MSLPDGNVLGWRGAEITATASYETKYGCDTVTYLAEAVTYCCDVVTALLSYIGVST
jgi:hypothetical protein